MEGGQAEQLSDAMDHLGKNIAAQGIGVSEKLDHASFRIKETVDSATTLLTL
jgi:hypothetical protein